jgi:hypothetical protein
VTDRTQLGAVSCEACEAMCLDAVDETLTTAEQAVFDRHIAGCMACSEQLAEARRGAAWMEMLKGHRPEPPAGMLQRILAQTSEAEVSRAFPRHEAMPAPRLDVVPVAGRGATLWHWIGSTFAFDAAQAHFQPRMAMTAAMAFFSIALTLNLGGVRLADLRPAAIHRGIADVRASAVRSFQNMRVVYQFESRVNALRDDDRDLGGPFNGSESKDAPKQETPGVINPAPQQDAPQQDEKPKAKDIPNGTSEVILPSLQRVSSDNVSSNRDAQQIAPDAQAPRMQRGA